MKTFDKLEIGDFFRCFAISHLSRGALLKTGINTAIDAMNEEFIIMLDWKVEKIKNL